MKEKRDKTYQVHTTYLLRPQTQSNFFILLVQHEDTIFDLVSPQQLIALQVLDSFVGGYELSNARLSYIVEIFLRFFPWLGDTHFKQTCS